LQIKRKTDCSLVFSQWAAKSRNRRTICRLPIGTKGAAMLTIFASGIIALALLAALAVPPEDAL
jgi:hypothetical protein